MVKEICWLNGEWGQPSEMKVPVEDRGYLFGEGVYEAMLAYNHMLWDTDDHLDRLERSLRLMEMAMPLPRMQLRHVLNQAVAQIEGDTTIMVYMQVTRGYCGPRTHSYADCAERTSLMIIARQFREQMELMRQGAKAILQPDLRWGHCDIKTLNLIPNTMASTAAARAGAYTAILHRDGFVTEAAAYGLFIAKGGELITRPLTPDILPSVTRQRIMERADAWDLRIREEEYTVEQLLAADEVMLVSTTLHPLPVLRVDDTVIGNGRVGPLARKIFAGYESDLEAVCGPITARK